MTSQFDTAFADATIHPVYVEGGSNGSARQGATTPDPANLAATVAATDYVFGWVTSAGASTTVNHIMLQNNTAAAVNWELDAVATAGAASLAAGQTVFLDIVTSKLHLRTAAAQNVNGAVAANIVVRGWQ